MDILWEDRDDLPSAPSSSITCCLGTPPRSFVWKSTNGFSAADSRHKFILSHKTSYVVSVTTTHSTDCPVTLVSMSQLVTTVFSSTGACSRYVRFQVCQLKHYFSVRLNMKLLNESLKLLNWIRSC